MSPRLHRLILVASLLGLSPAFAEEPKSAETVSPYQLQKKSTFTAMTEDARAPFWPIGWAKQKAGQPVQAVAAAPTGPKVLLDEHSFKVSSILLGAPSMAIINGRTYSEGEFLRNPRPAPAAAGAPATPSAPRIRVYRIADGNVILQCESQLITVALLRPELAAKRQDEELINEDRP